ncbi:MAG: hypothetical protein EXS64_15575 [Candidatus Latescibacteria bacterium]|nr:hypothetical protein [Candidatus Latescibacterota bacterium]
MKQPVFVAALLAFLGASPSVAQVPHLLNYQGHLAAGDTALAGTFKIAFSVYAGPTGSSPLWTETQTVPVTDGLFSVSLGSVVPIPQALFAEGDRYLGVRVENDPEMTPRQRVVSVGYAFRAEMADDVKGRDISPASVTISGAGPVIDRQGRWVGGNVTARAVTADSVVISGVGVVIDREGKWTGLPQPFKLNYVTVGPKGSAESPIALITNTWTDIEAFSTSVRVTTPSVLDVRFDGMLVAGSNCMLRVRVDGNALAGNLSGVDDAQTAERRHTAVGISAVVPVGPGVHDVVLQGIVSSVGTQFLSGRLQNGLLTVRIYAQ